MSDPKFTLPKEYWGRPKTPEYETVIIQLGRVGDLLNILPVAKAMHDKTGRKTRIVTCTDNLPILERAPYVEAIEWKGSNHDAQGAAKMVQALPFDPPGIKIVCCQFFGNMIQSGRNHANFLIEQWALLGYADQWGTLPLELNRNGIVGQATPKKPYVVISLESYSSPCPVKNQLKALIMSACHDLEVIDAGAIKLENFVDMLDLLDNAEALISVDSALIHLNRATSTPSVLFGKGIEKRWHLSYNAGNVVRSFTYEQFTDGNVMQSIDECGKFIHELVHRRQRNETITVVTGGDDKFRPLANLCRQSLDAAEVKKVVQFSPLPTVEGKEQSWWKLKAILKMLDAVNPKEWVMWIDADCVVRKGPFSPQLGDFDMMISQDWNGPCMGIFACRNTPFCRQLIETMLFLGASAQNVQVHGRNDGPKWEQDCIKTLLHFYPDVKRRIGFFHASFTTDHPQDDPSFCTPIHHWGGRSLNLRVAGMTRDVGNVQKDKLVIFCYLPPAHIQKVTTGAFLKNIEKYPPSSRLVILSDDASFFPSRVIPDIVQEDDHYRTSTRMFDHVIAAAEDYSSEYFMMVENDCRVKGKDWDKEMLDNALMFTRQMVLAGTPVDFHCEYNGAQVRQSARRSTHVFYGQTGIQIQSLTDEKWLPKNEWALFPNGAFAIYKTSEAVAAWRNANRELPYDMALAQAIKGKIGEAQYLRSFSPVTNALSFSCEAWITRDAMKKKLSDGEVFGIHNIKDNWTP